MHAMRKASPMSKVIKFDARLAAHRRIDTAGDRAAGVMARLDRPAEAPPRVPVFLRSIPSRSVTVDPAVLARIEAAVLPGREHWRSVADAPQRRDYEHGGRLDALQRLIGGEA